MEAIKCHVCDCDIEIERANLDLDTCKSCAFKINTPKVRGYMEYSHKTAPTMRVVQNPDDFEEFYHNTNRIGQSSILRHQMVGNGRLQQ